MYGRALCCPPQTVTALLFSSTPIENKSFLKNWLTLGTSKKSPTVYHNCQIIRLAKSFIWVFCNIIWKSLKELFGQPSISLKAVTWVTLLQNETILWESHYCGFDFEKTTLFYFLIPEFLQLAIFFPKENGMTKMIHFTCIYLFLLVFKFNTFCLGLYFFSTIICWKLISSSIFFWVHMWF